LTKKTIIIIIIAIIIVLINLIFVVYLFDSNNISVNADTDSDNGVTNLNELPSPDSSTINKFFTKLIEPFYKK